MENTYGAEWMKPKQYSGNEPGGDFQSSRLDSPHERWHVFADKILTKTNSQRNDLGSPKQHPCVRHFSRVYIEGKLIKEAQCYGYSMLGCSGTHPVYHKCEPKYQYYNDLKKMFITDCKCKSKQKQRKRSFLSKD